MFGNSTETFLPKLTDIGVDFAKASLRIALIIGIAYLGLRLLRVAFNRLETLLNRAAAAAEVTPGAATKRVLTLMSVLWTIVVGLVWFVVVLMTLGQLGVNVTPVLAGAGIVGLAIGFGAQNLVKDLERFLSHPRKSSPGRRCRYHQRHRRIGGSDLVSNHRFA